MMNFQTVLSDGMTPKLSNENKRLNLWMATSLVKKIDDWRRQQPELPNISEAIRRLVELGLEASKKGRR